MDETQQLEWLWDLVQILLNSNKWNCTWFIKITSAYKDAKDCIFSKSDGSKTHNLVLGFNVIQCMSQCILFYASENLSILHVCVFMQTLLRNFWLMYTMHRINAVIILPLLILTFRNKTQALKSNRPDNDSNVLERYPWFYDYYKNFLDPPLLELFPKRLDKSPILERNCFWSAGLPETSKSFSLSKGLQGWFPSRFALEASGFFLSFLLLFSCTSHAGNWNKSHKNWRRLRYSANYNKQRSIWYAPKAWFLRIVLYQQSLQAVSIFFRSTTFF